MSKTFVASSLLSLAAAAVVLPVGCASRADGDAVQNLGTSQQGLGVDAAGASDGGAVKGSIVISQVYGGSAEMMGVVNRDFIEILNRTKTPISLDGLALHIADGNENFGSKVIPLSGAIAGYGYYLVALQPLSPVMGTPLIAADLTPATPPALDGITGGKVALVAGTLPLLCGGATRCAGTKYLDLVGFGAATDWEGPGGSDRVGEVGEGKAVLRKGNGCTDTNVNVADFTVGAPTPRNTDSPPTDCSVPPAPRPDAAPPVVDPPLGEEPPDTTDAGRDAGRGTNNAAAADDSGCSVGFVGAGNLSGILVLSAAGVVVAARRRKRRRS